MGNVCRCFKQEENNIVAQEEKSIVAYDAQPERVISSAFSIDNINELDEMIREVKKLSKFKNLRFVDDVETITSTTPHLSEKLNNRIQVVATWSNQFEEKLLTPAKEVAQTELINSISKELASVLHYIGSLHWACVGLAFIAFAINQVDQKNKNQQQCCDLLLKLVQFWEIAIRPLLNHADELVQKYIDKAIDVIAESVLFCGQFLHRGLLPRLTFADSHKNTLYELKEKVKDARDEIKDILFFDLYAKVSRHLVEHQQLPHKRKSSIFTVALTQRVEKVLRLLNLEERDTIRAVVLHGMGGVGKSTLADSVYDNEIRWIGDIACSCIRLRQGFSVVELQKQMIKDLNIGDLLKENCRSVKEELWQALSSLDRRVFIYIDNILEVKDLEDFLPTFFEQIKLPKGSRLVLTTRDLNVCTKVLGRNKSIDIHKYPVECLNLKEGKELLEAYAFGIPSEEYVHHEGGIEKDISEELIEKIVETCGRLPLAITVLGKQLYGADDREWERALEKLNRTNSATILEDRVFNVLQYSYDALDVDCRKAFVFVSTWLDVMGNATPWWMLNSITESLCAGVSLETLANYSLVEPSQFSIEQTGQYRLTVKMHDLLLSLGHQIAKRENIRSKRVQDESSFQEMDTTKWCDIQWLMIDDIEGGFPAHLLDKCERLEMLILEATLSGRPEKVPTNLKVLHLSRTREDDIPWNLASLENLVYFETNLGCSTFPASCKQIRIFRGFDNERFPEEELACNRLRSLKCLSSPEFPRSFFQRMTCLRCLRLVGDGDLPQDLGGLRNLQALYIDSDELQELPQSLVELSRLRVLQLYCSALAQLPQGFVSGLKALCYLRIRSSHMTSLPQDMGNLKELQFLNLRLPMLQSLPPTLSQLSKLLNFKLVSCSPLKNLAGLEGQLASLESLTLQYSRNFSPHSAFIPSTLLHSLEKLQLFHFPLRELPPAIGKLVSLKVLRVKDAPLLEMLPKELASLPSLEVMCLQNCPMLTTLQEGQHHLSEEADDNIINNYISSLPSSLNSLIVAKCPSLQVHSINSLPPNLIQIYETLPQSIASFFMNTFNHPHLDMLADTLF